MTKVLIIGQAPGSSPVGPLGPLSGPSGDRLAELCGLTKDVFLDRFDRVNLLDRREDEELPMAQLRLRARRLLPDLRERHTVVVLGTLAAAALLIRTPELRWDGYDVPGETIMDEPGPARRIMAAWCPHPSGRNRWWNRPDNVERARDFWSHLAASAAP